MATIVIDTKTNKNTEFILEFIKKIGEKGKVLTRIEREDFLFGQIIQKERTGRKVSRDTIMKNLA